MLSKPSLLSLTLALVFVVCSTHVAAKSAEEWRELSIYQVITDRFALTDGSTPECFIRNYCGGTWKGLENKLDYIQGMGFEAVWISPVIHQIEENTTFGQAFHGYWGNDPFRLNEHFGPPEDLKSLSDALHSRNMSLMLDVVINHLAANANASNVDYNTFPPPFNTKSAFHSPCLIDFGSQLSIERCWLVTDPPPSLADINSENTVVFDAMVSSVVDIVNTYGIDGIRLDTARHIPKPDLAKFQETVGVFVTGEALNDSVAFETQYQGPQALDSVLNYPLWFQIADTFTGRTTFDYLGATIRAENSIMNDVTTLLNFLDNHDQPRLASRTGNDVVKDMNAATFLFFMSGMPTIYYGFEQRFNGAFDPLNREGLWESGYDTSATLYHYISQLSKIRALAASVVGKSNYFSSQAEVLGTGETGMAIQRGPVVVAVSNIGSNSTQPPSFDIQGSQFQMGEQIVDLLSCETMSLNSTAGFTNIANGGHARVWIRSSQKGDFC